MVDCLFIGHNEMQFEEYEKTARMSGTGSVAYRDLNLNYVWHDNRPFSAPDIFNLFQSDPCYASNSRYGTADAFSAAIAYLGTYLHRRNFSFDYIISFQNEKEQLIEKLKKNNIMAVAITTTLYVSLFPILEIVSFIKKYNNSVKIIIGGPFVSTNVRTQDELTLEYIFNTINADFYINSSQGETALVNILSAMKQSLPFMGIDNIIYKDGEGYTTTTQSKEDNLLEENMVDWNLFSDRLSGVLNIRTSVSCPFSCAFCGFPQHAGKYQTVSVEAVERELNAIKRLNKDVRLQFIDDTFNVPPERFKEILKMMIRNEYNFKWNSYYRCQYADKETIKLMKDSGCEGVFLGIESGSQKILNNMNKSTTVEKYEKGHYLLRESNIVTFASFIVGFPGETHATAEETLKFIERNRPTFYRAQVWYCEPITSIWNEREKYNIKGSQFEWSHNTMTSHVACDLVDNMLLSIKDSIWLPQYNFCFPSVSHMLQRGMNLEQVKQFVGAFSDGMKEKLSGPRDKNINTELIEKMKKACTISDRTKTALNSQGTENTLIDKYSADFTF